LISAFLKLSFSCSRESLVLLLLSDDVAASSRLTVKPPPHFLHRRVVICTGASDVACPGSDGDTGTTGAPSASHKKIIPEYLYGLKTSLMAKNFKH